jgi:D-3-phosphoglycerate dehydrogenase
MPKIFISTVPFGEIDPKAVQLLQQTGWEFEINSLGRKLKPEEVAELAGDCDGLIAGTEGIGTLVESSKKLKMISRVGIGLDSVPLNLCRTKGIVVSYTPDAVTKAVAELTLGAMLSITRFVPQADRNMRKRDWKRLMGKRIEHSVIGILGMGRIGTKVMHMLAGFSPQEILIADIKDKQKEIDDLRTQHGLKI